MKKYLYRQIGYTASCIWFVLEFLFPLPRQILAFLCRAAKQACFSFSCCLLAVLGLPTDSFPGNSFRLDRFYLWRNSATAFFPYLVKTLQKTNPIGRKLLFRHRRTEEMLNGSCLYIFAASTAKNRILNFCHIYSLLIRRVLYLSKSALVEISLPLTLSIRNSWSRFYRPALERIQRRYSHSRNCTAIKRGQCGFSQPFGSQQVTRGVVQLCLCSPCQIITHKHANDVRTLEEAWPQ